ncbi:MAG: dienelactone hydrolase family protein [Desulfobacterales bacterium]|jgi:dienelactone hydrolase
MNSINKKIMEKSEMRNSFVKIVIMATLALAAGIATTTFVEAKIISKPVPYESEGFQLEGYLAYDDNFKEKRPGVLVVHEWWGLTDGVRKRVDQLAAMGYVAFALDLYGKGKTTTDLKKATKMLRMVQMNVYRWHQRCLAGLDVLRKLPQVDSQRIAAIGYGWGGVTLHQQLFKGVDINGAIMFSSFIAPTLEQSQEVKAKILVLQGAADPYVDSGQISNYVEAMNKADIDWQMILYGGAKHGFTNPDAAQYKLKEFEYNEIADRRSWNQVGLFLSELFAKEINQK